MSFAEQQPITKSRVISVIRRHLPALLVAWTVCVLIAWPMFPPSQLGTHIHSSDGALNAFLLAWFQTAIFTQPFELYDTNVFYPQRHTGAGSSAVLTMAIFSLPLRLFNNPVLMYNAATYLAVLLSATSMYAFAYWLFRHRRAAVVAAIIFAASGDVLYMLPGGINIPSAYTFPLGVMFALMVLTKPSILKGCLLTATIIATYCTEWYYGIILLTALGMIFLVSLFFRRNLVQTKGIYTFLIAIAISLAAGAILSTPHRNFSKRIESGRSISEVIFLSGTVEGYIIPASYDGRYTTITGRLLKPVVSHEIRGEDSQFFGYIPYLIALMGFLILLKGRHGTRFQRWAVIGILAGAITAFLFSLGPYLFIRGNVSSIRLPWFYVLEMFPFLSFMRAISRYAIFVGFGVAILVAYGITFSSLFNSSQKILKTALFAGVLGFLLFEYYPISYPEQERWDSEPKRILDKYPEFQIVTPVPLHHPPFLLDITRHFPRTPSGHIGGLTNFHYEVMLGLMNQGFFSDIHLDRVEALGSDALAVYGSEYFPLADASPRLELLEKSDNFGLYRILPSGRTAEIEIERQRLFGISEKRYFHYHLNFPEPDPGMEVLTIARSVGADPYLSFVAKSYSDPWEITGFEIPEDAFHRLHLKIAVESKDHALVPFIVAWKTTEQDYYPADGPPHWPPYFVRHYSRPDGQLYVITMWNTFPMNEGRTIDGFKFFTPVMTYPGMKITVYEARVEYRSPASSTPP